MLSQTDRSIYRPGDYVRFRTFILDSLARPYHSYELSLKVTDGIRNIVYKNDALAVSAFNGVYEDEFTLDELAGTGKYRIEIVEGERREIEDEQGQRELLDTVFFEVNKLNPPRFAVNLKSKHSTLLSENVLKLNIVAKYSLGYPVNGIAEVKVTVAVEGQPSSKWEGTTKTVELDSESSVDFNLNDDLKLSSDMAEKVFVTFSVEFEEISTGVKTSATHTTKVCKDFCNEIEFVQSEPKLKPGLSYNFQVAVYTMDTRKLLIDDEHPVQVNVIYSNEAESIQETNHEVELDEGLANFSIDIPRGTNSITITAKYLSSTKSVNVTKATSKSGEYLKFKLTNEK